MATGSWGPAIDERELARTYVRIGLRFFHDRISAEVLALLSR